MAMIDQFFERVLEGQLQFRERISSRRGSGGRQLVVDCRVIVEFPLLRIDNRQTCLA